MKWLNIFLGLTAFQAHQHFTFAQNLVGDSPKTMSNEIRTINKNNIVIGIQYGHFGIFPMAKTNDNTTNLKISDYHKMLNLVTEYYPFEEIAAQFSIGLMLITKEQTIDSIIFTPGSGPGGIQAKGSGKGGAVLPVTFGIKKTFLKGGARPYVSLLSGFTYIKVGTGSGSGSIYGVEENVDYQSAFIFCYQLGTGIQLKTGKSVRFDVGINFYGSPRIIPSIGGINYYQGFYVFGGMNFILNPKK
jgi:hypothetical protein